MVDWKLIWDARASSSNPFETMGRSDNSIFDFLVLMDDIQRKFGGIFQNDQMLEIGCGIGCIASYYSPWVARISCIDNSDAMVSRAKMNLKSFLNVNCYNDSIPKLSKTLGQSTRFSKIIVGSVLQYLNSFDEVIETISNLSLVSQSSCKILFTMNPDLSLKDEYMKSYKTLNLDSDRLQKSLEIENSRLWIDFSQIEMIAEQSGFTHLQKLPVNSAFWQSNHMFDFILAK